MDIWKHCLDRLGDELSAQQLSTWIRPLHPIQDDTRLRLLAPNSFVLDWVRQHYLNRLNELVTEIPGATQLVVSLEIGSAPAKSVPMRETSAPLAAQPISLTNDTAVPTTLVVNTGGVSRVNREFSFESFVEGKSNQLARAAGMQIGENPGRVYNPLFIYGGVGLGKTHLMHAIGNLIADRNENAKVVYLHSEGFVAEMVKALQHGTIDEFKRRMRSVNALLIDDVQFFGGKERSQEEFFHTFNALFESQQQIILTSDRFPKEVDGLEDRLKSRFGWGLTVAIEPPDLETRVAILKSKALQLFNVDIPNEVAFFVGKRVRSNIRELEGALRRIIANSEFTGRPITLDFTKDALRDMIAAQDKQITVENIQKTVAEYYKIRVADLLSPKRSRMVARPRQVAMTLARELTHHSLPEIGDAFGGRDHTTVLYATSKISELRETDARISEDFNNLLRILSH